MGAHKTKKNCLSKENFPVCKPGFIPALQAELTPEQASCSVLNYLAETLLPLQAEYRIFGDLPGFNNPSIITGERYRPDLLLENTNKSVLYIIELTVGFDSNLESNAHRKKK